MAYSEDALNLRLPEVVQLARIEDRLTYLFLDRVRIEQGRTGLEAWSADEQGNPLRTSIPCASLALLALGPGTSITTPALTTLHHSGTTVIITGADGLISYTTSKPLNNDSRWACAQASLWANPETRLTVARHMYEKRFGHAVPPETPLATLRGLEGQNVKQTYKTLAAQHKIRNFHRNSSDPEDRVNQNLNLGNSLLYGLSMAVCNALSINPALGFIHHGRPNSLLYDLADLYKLTTTVPVAFRHAKPYQHPRTFTTELRAEFHKQNILKRLVRDTIDLLTPGLPIGTGADSILSETGYVEGMKNWAEP